MVDSPLTRVARWLAGAFVVALVALLFASFVVVGLFVHLDLGLTRAVAQDVVNRVFASTFEGDVRLGPIRRLRPDVIEVATFDVAAADGRQAIYAEGVTVEGRWIRRVARLLLGGDLVIPKARIEHAVVGLDRLGGDLDIVRAFAVRPDPKPPPPAPPDEGVGIVLSAVDIGSIAFSGSPADGVPLTGKVTDGHVQMDIRTGQLVLHVTGARLQEEALLGAVFDGTVDYHLVLAADEEPSLRMWTDAEAVLGAAPVSVRASLSNDGLEAEVKLPRVGSEELAPWVPDSPLVAPVSAVVKAHGAFPNIRLDAEIDLPSVEDGAPGHVSLRGQMVTDSALTVAADVDVAHLDGRLIGQLATDLDAAVRVHGRLAGDPELLALIRVARATLDEAQIGRVEGTARVSSAGVDVAFLVDEQGAPLDGGLRYRAADQHLAFAIRTDADLQRFARLAAVLGPDRPTRGRARVTAVGTFVGGELDVATRTRLSNVRWPAQQATLVSGVVDGRIHGKTDDLRIDAGAHGGGLAVGEESVPTFAVSAKGPLAKPVVIARGETRGRSVVARALVDAKQASAVGVQVDVTHGTTTLRTKVKSVRPTAGGVALEGITVDGLGKDVVGGLRVVGGEIVGKLQGEDIDLTTLSNLLGLRFNFRGTVDLDMDLEPTKDGRRGHVALDLHDGGYLVVNGVQAELRADFDGKRVIPSGEIRIVNEMLRKDTQDLCEGTIATVSLGEGDGQLDGPLLNAATWQDAAGSVRVTATDVKLNCVAEVWRQFNPLRDLPFQKLDGVLNAAATLTRASRQRFPSLGDVRASTVALVLDVPGEDGGPDLVSDKLDLALFGALDGTSGKLASTLHVIESATRSDLAQLVVEADLSLPTLVAGGPPALESLLTSPMSASLRTQRGKTSRWLALPEPVRTYVADVDLEGEVEVDAFLEGTLRDPSAAIRLRAWGLGSLWGLPTDMDVLASYHGGVGRLDAKVRRDEIEVASVRGESTGNLANRLFGGADQRWTGWLTASLNGLPLETLPPLARANIRGDLIGNVSVRGLGDKPRMTASMRLPSLQLGRAKFKDGSLSVEPVAGAAGMFTVLARLPLEGRGGLTARAYATLDWQDELIPKPNTSKPAGFHLVAERFPLAVIEPFVVGTATRVDGTLEGEMRVRYRELGGTSASVDVNMKVADGIVDLPGQSLTDIGATITSKPSIIHVDDVTVTANKGKMTGKASIRLDDLSLADVTGTFAVEEDSPVPVVLDGVPLGRASGGLVLRYLHAKGDEGNRLELSLTDGRMKLPASSTADVQPLDEHPDITVSLPTGPPPEEDEGSNSNLDVTVAFDKLIIEKGQTRIVISTASPIVLSADGKISGEIAVIGGELNLLGKIFRFERGLVRLRAEEPGNPYVNVTAYWTAPNGTIIFVDYSGLLLPLSDEKITFRSTPPLGESELLGLLLLGEGGDVSEGGADRAAALSRGIAAAQFNAVLGDIAPGLSTSFASTEGYIGTTLIYQLSESVTAKATVEQADGTQTNTSTSGSDDAGARTSVSIDWRFAPHWLLRGTLGVGQQSSSGLDVLYQFRY